MAAVRVPGWTDVWGFPQSAGVVLAVGAPLDLPMIAYLREQTVILALPDSLAQTFMQCAAPTVVEALHAVAQLQALVGVPGLRVLLGTLGATQAVLNRLETHTLITRSPSVTPSP